MEKIFLLILFVACMTSFSSAVRLKVCAGNNKKFCYNGQEVYLSGMNQAWSSYHFYARDFGNYYYNNYTRSNLTWYLRNIRANGGNSIRIFLHTDSQETPCFNFDGSVGAADCSGNHIIEELKEYLCVARRYHIIVFFVLWNGASFNTDINNTNAGPQFNGLINDEDKLRSYINNALIPIVTALKNYPSLGGYDIINEPEGIVITDHAGPGPACHDATILNKTGAGFGSKHPNLFWMHRLQRFVNWQAHAIKLYDPNSLVTVGSWSEKSQYNPALTNPPSVEPTTFNYFSDSCLFQAGGSIYPKGVLDFYQMHTYSHGTTPYNVYSPMNRFASFYNLNKPLVIGEFSSVASLSLTKSKYSIFIKIPRSIESLVSHAYTCGYAGAWSWHAAAVGDDTDTFDVQADGLRHIRCRAGVRFYLRNSVSFQCPSRINRPNFVATFSQCPATTSTTPVLTARPINPIRRPSNIRGFGRIPLF